MPTVRVKGVKNAIEFPYDMDINDIKEVLQRKFTKQAVEGTQPVDLNPLQGQARATEQSLAEKAGQGISNALYDSGIISDRYGAQRIGENVTSIGEFLPVIGDATAGDEFGRALKQGDGAGMAIGALGAIPLVGDAAKKAFKGANPINMYDTTRNRLLRKESTVNLPQGNLGSDEFDRIKDLDPNAKVVGRNDDDTIKISYLKEYSPKQVNKDNDFLFEFDPDALEITEPYYKNVETYRGDPNKPISVTKKDGDFFILDGHHRAKLAKGKGENVKAVVIPFDDVEKMKKDNVHPADMFSEWVATGQHKQTTNKAMSVGGVINNTNKGLDNELTRATNQAIGTESGGIRGGIGFLDEQGREVTQLGRSAEGNLAGLPTNVKGFTPRHNPRIANVAKNYIEKKGGVYAPSTQYANINPQNSTNIANEFENMKHNPSDPEVQEAYSEMIKEVKEQYQAALDDGLKVEFIDFSKQGDPYAKSPRMANEDIDKNNHMYTFSTSDGFGSDDTFDVADNPLLQETEFMISGKPALANDLFRVVHDYFGHAKEGLGFRAAGEENAWRAHSAMFSPKARRAMTSETRGQNSWVNYGKFGEKNRTATSNETVFADQKIGLLPQWVSDGKPKPD